MRNGDSKPVQTLSVRRTRHWDALPREIVDVPPLEVFKGSLDRAGSSLVSLSMSGVLERDDFNAPPNPGRSVVL